MSAASLIGFVCVLRVKIRRPRWIDQIATEGYALRAVDRRNGRVDLHDCWGCALGHCCLLSLGGSTVQLAEALLDPACQRSTVLLATHGPRIPAGSTRTPRSCRWRRMDRMRSARSVLVSLQGSAHTLKATAASSSEGSPVRAPR